MTTDRINPASVVGRLSSMTCIPQIRPYAVRLALYCFPLGPTHDDSAEVSLRRPALRPRVPIAHCRGHWRFRNHGHARISLRLDPRNLPGDARRHPVIEVRAVADQAVNGNIPCSGGSSGIDLDENDSAAHGPSVSSIELVDSSTGPMSRRAHRERRGLASASAGASPSALAAKRHIAPSGAATLTARSERGRVDVADAHVGDFSALTCCF